MLLFTPLARFASLLIALLFVSISAQPVVLRAAADELPGSEIEALKDYPNWVAEICGSANASEGGPLTGVHFPRIDDPLTLAKAIDDYIKKGWPHSPLIGYGAKFVQYGQQYDVNPTISTVIAQVEYQFGTARTDLVGKGGPGQYNFWAVTHNSNSSTRFGAYPSIDTAMEEHFKLLGGKSASAQNGISYIGPPQNFTTVSQIMKQYAPSFENDTPKYIKTILDGMKKLLSNSGAGAGGGSSSGSSCGDASGSSGNVNIDGYAFPIAAKKKSDYATFGALSAVPCDDSTGCHHPFHPRGSYAFDLGVKGYGPDRSQNAPVYAISDGELVHVTYTRNGGRCNQLEFKSDKDGYVYWYGHLAPDPSIKKGQHYKAGQQIGKVGPSRCADNTAPHLHIDRGYPKGAMGGSEDHRDAGIIDLINKLYGELPD
ncbi:MAG: M23 family metallopeptidase [Patescibacteria group bacterium]|mgnify:CR=1 FL=1